MMITQNHDWRYDLKVGQEGETFLSRLLRADEVSFTVEVKLDTMAHRTGNLFFEYESRGKSSGLKTTQSDFYAVMTANKHFVIIVRTEILKDALRNWQTLCVKQNRNPERTWQKRGGDDMTSVGMLVPIPELIAEIRQVMRNQEKN